MAPSSTRRSSGESDYRELYEAAIHDRVRDCVAYNAQASRRGHVHENLDNVKQDDGLTKAVTQLSNDVGLVREKLGAIDVRLDPHNEAFDFRVWATTFLQLLREDGILKANAGVVFKALSVTGRSSSIVLQPTVASPLVALARLPLMFSKRPKKESKIILHDMNGCLNSGEMLLVLGRPGSGSTTFLKTMVGHTQGLMKSPETSVTYDGVKQDDFLQQFRGRAVYNQENDEHLPHLTVSQTLEFAACSQTPQTRLQGVTREMHATHMVNVILRIFGLSHVRDTKVGNDTIRGVSGGERKRVSIAEMALTRSSLAAWDNSTRGLDSATALEFVNHLRVLSDLVGVTQMVAIYQASQAMYDLFDKVTVLYEGKQIYFGPADAARSYFRRMGWYCSPRQTTPDFLTSITNVAERQPVEDLVGQLPQTATEFEQYWLRSEEYATVIAQIRRKEASEDPTAQLESIRAAHNQAQAHHTRQKSPYLLSIWMQIRLCMRRAAQLLWNDRGSTVALALGRIVLALIVGSIYFNPPDTTASLQSRGSIIFLATLMNALMTVTEIGPLFGKREVVLKQKNYGFYHPAADALASYVVDIPVKFVISTLFNVVFYFLGGLRAEASNFFVFLLFNFIGTLLMSAVFRSVGAASKQMAQAYALCGVGILIMIMYTGYALQTTYMHPWFRWINYINPVGYVFEALLVNEVHGWHIPCAPDSIIPSYGAGSNFVCAIIGSEPGQRTVLGDNWVQSSYNYSYANIWRNLGIAFGYLVFFLGTYLLATEFKTTSDITPQRLVFRDRNSARGLADTSTDVEKQKTSLRVENKTPVPIVQEKKLSDSPTPSQVTELGPAHSGTRSSGTLTWENLSLEIDYMDSHRRLLDEVCGWTTGGRMTCLMGPSGAGKTTLLDALAQRQNSNCQVSGTIKMDGAPLLPSFQRKTGYVQQQDLHLATSTVREALQFSALLRQPAHVQKADKLAFVDEVISMLDMHTFCDAIVGRVGEGLNIEQRKLLTIGVELAAKPTILFLDEPTSGLDSQSAWTIVTLLRTLANNGQAILTTIHQPSALIFQQFDSILLLAKQGRTAYFGELGPDCRTLTGYFESKGAHPCGGEANPAEYVLRIASDPSTEWHTIWKHSQERVKVLETLQTQTVVTRTSAMEGDDQRAYALPLTFQLRLLLNRTFQAHWRNPAYIYAKLQFAILAGLFIGFTFFLQNSSLTGLQNLVFAIYMLNSTFSTVVNQIMSRFLQQRALFEVRESPSRMYSWVVFVLAHIIVEIPYQLFLGIIVWACWYFPVFGMHQPGSSQGMMLAFCLQFMLFGSTWAQMLIFSMPSVETAGALSNILFTMTLQFNGVLQPPSALPGFWIFMYRASPFTYLVGGFASVGLENRPVNCAENELAVFDPPAGQNCGAYMSRYIEGGAPGALLNPSATTSCEYCPLSNANDFLARSWIYPADKYRNLGVLFAFIFFNIGATVVFYYVFRVRHFKLRKALGSKTAKADNTNTGHRRKKSLRKKLWFYLGLYYDLSLIVLKNMVR